MEKLGRRFVSSERTCRILRGKLNLSIDQLQLTEILAVPPLSVTGASAKLSLEPEELGSPVFSAATFTLDQKRGVFTSRLAKSKSSLNPAGGKEAADTYESYFDIPASPDFLMPLIDEQLLKLMYCVVDSVVALPSERKSLVSLYQAIMAEIPSIEETSSVLASAIWDFVALISGCERWLGHPNYVAGKFAASFDRANRRSTDSRRPGFPLNRKRAVAEQAASRLFHPKWT